MSRKYTLSSGDVEKVVTGFCIAIAGAAITYLLEVIPTIDFGVWTPVVVAATSTLVNLLRKYIAGW